MNLIPESPRARRRIVRSAQALIILAVGAYLIVSTALLISLIAKNGTLLNQQKEAVEFHQEQAALADKRAEASLKAFSKDLGKHLVAHDKRTQEFLKDLRFEVRSLPDGTTRVIVTRVPTKPPCERLPNGNCRPNR